MSVRNSQSLATRRKIEVKGSGGVSATMVVTVYRETVWVSIQPLFTWEAIMEPEKVDDLIAVLGQAKEDAQRNAQQERGAAPVVETRPVSRGRIPPALPPSQRPGPS